MILTTLILAAFLLPHPSASADATSQGIACVTAGPSSVQVINALAVVSDPCDSSYTQVSANKECNGWAVGSWDVQGHYKTGSGQVKFWVACDSTELVKCVTAAGEKVCVSDDVPPIDGPFHCYYKVLDGNPADIAGTCQDPVNPGRVVAAIPAPDLPALPPR